MTSILTTGAREDTLERIFYIRYPVKFKKNKTPLQAFIDSESEVNVMHISFAKQLGLSSQSTDVRAQKIDGTMLDTNGMVVAAFSVVDKSNRVRFLEKTFLMANVSPEVVLGIFFLILSSADIDFSSRELQWKTYTTKKALPTTRRVKLVGKKEFAAAALDPKHETYVVHIVSLSSTPLITLLDVHPFRGPQISSLITKEAPMKVPAKYLDFANIFSSDLASELLEHSGINDHTIKLVNGC